MRIEILRRDAGADATAAYWQRFDYEPVRLDETAATALTRLNERPVLTDADGRPAKPIRWDCSCLQKKCGACAMVIDGRPGLACDAFLREHGSSIRLEPLKKFPVVADLIVDRQPMRDNLERLRVWLAREADEPAAAGGGRDGRRADRRNDAAYEASRCMQCGCCLEVCPNFYAADGFAGTAAAMPLARLLAKLPVDARRETAEIWRRNFFEGCGKSLACRDICPAGIDIDALLARSNAVSLWGKLSERR